MSGLSIESGPEIKPCDVQSGDLVKLHSPNQSSPQMDPNPLTGLQQKLPRKASASGC